MPIETGRGYVGPPIEVGDSVLLHVGRNVLEGTVLEDRGRYGQHDERILRIRVELGDGIGSEFEVPEVALERLGPRRRATRR